MERRRLLAWVGSAPLLLVIGTTASQPLQKVRRIGLLAVGDPPTPEFIRTFWVPAQELGWVEGRNLVVDRRYTTNLSQLPALARKLVESEVEVLITLGTDATLAAMTATSRIPILMASTGDAVLSKLVGDLRRPGGNVTGVSLNMLEVNRKLLFLTKEALPAIKSVGLVVAARMASPGVMLDHLQRTTISLGLQPTVIDADVAKGPDLVPYVTRSGVQAVVWLSRGLQWSNADADAFVPALAAARLPTMVSDRKELLQGGLLSFEFDEAERARAFAYCLDRLLTGAKPADVPVQEPARFTLRVNMRTARMLGITLPASLLQRADELID